jgi:hypothetical protein
MIRAGKEDRQGEDKALSAVARRKALPCAISVDSKVF